MHACRSTLEDPTPADVAECLAQFDPREDSESFTSVRLPRPEVAPTLRQPDAPKHPGQGQPPSAVATPRSGRSTHDSARERSTYAASNAGSWQFVLLGAGFVGLLGLGAALLARDPRAPHRTTPTAAIDEAAAAVPLPIPSGSPTGVSTTTPIIDIGDVDDRPNPATKAGGQAKPRIKPTLAPPPASSPSGAGKTK